MGNLARGTVRVSLAGSWTHRGLVGCRDHAEARPGAGRAVHSCPSYPTLGSMGSGIGGSWSVGTMTPQVVAVSSLANWPTMSVSPT
mgnify:FL=1